MWLKDSIEMRFGDPEEYEAAGGSQRNTLKRRDRHGNRP